MSSPGSAARGSRPRSWSSSRASGSRGSSRGRRRRAPSGCPGSPSPGSPTPTRTPSSGRCAVAPRPGAARSGAGARRCTSSRRRSSRRATSASPGRRTPRWRSPGSPRWASSTTCTTVRAACRTTDPNELGRTLVAAAARGRDPDHAARRLLPARRPGHRARGRPAAVLGRRRRALGGAGRGARRPRRGRATRRRDPQHPGGRPGLGGDGRRMGDGARLPASRPRLRAAGRERGHASPPTGARPTALLADAGALSPAFTAVHFTHVDAPDIALLGEVGAHCCLCPTTERDLADGIGPARAIADAGAGLALGSDSHAVIDQFEEMRAVELDQRLATGERGHHTAAELLRAAHRAGTRGARLAGGGDGSRRARSPTWSPSASTACGSPAPTRETALESLVFAATAADVRRVIVGGRELVRDGVAPRDRRRRPSCGTRSRRSSTRDGPGERMSALVIDNIGQLVTNDPELGEGPLGVVTDAALVCEDERVRRRRAGGRRRRRAPRRRRALRDPGLRRLAHAPGLRGRPGRGVRRADGGRAVRGRRDPGDQRGHRSRRRPRSSSRSPGSGVAEARRAGITHDRDQVRLRRSRSRASGACARSPPGSPTRSRSSARTRSRPSTRSRPDDYVALVCGEMLAACAPYCRWIDVFCERGAFDAEQSRAVLEAGRAAGLRAARARKPARPGAGGGARGRARGGLGRPLHLPRPRPTSRRSPAARRSPPSSRRPTSRPASPTPTRARSSTPAPRSRSRPTATRARATRRRWRSASPWPCASSG